MVLINHIVNVKMTKYKCGHDTKGIIILDSNPLSYCAYETWSNGVGVFGDRSECWECWNKHKE